MHGRVSHRAHEGTETRHQAWFRRQLVGWTGTTVPLTVRASGGITIRMEIDFDQLETHRPALTGHCYRMLGSAFGE
jgi:hypothetical protein